MEGDTMMRLADYFAIIGYDHSKSGKFSVVFVKRLQAKFVKEKQLEIITLTDLDLLV